MSFPLRKTALRRCALAALSLCAAGALQAQTAAPWPTKTIRIVVGFAPGGSTDVMARILAQSIGESLGQAVIIENKPGASGNIAAAEVVRAAPDGHAFLIAPTSVETANPSLFKSSMLPSRDLTPVGGVGRTQMYLVAKPQMDVKDARGLVALAKAQPGKLSYATPNSTSLVASETIKRIAGLDVLSVPYKSSPQALTDLIGGTVKMYVVDVGSGMGMINAGSVRVLGVTTKDPLKSMPNVVPIVKEVPGFDLTSWNGIFGPAGMPKPIVDKINAELQEALADKEVQKSLAQLGFETWPTKTPEEFAKYVADQLAHWSTLVKQAGIRAQ